MNCPDCSASINVGQQYCRACGKDLVASGTREIDRRFWGLSVMSLVFAGLLVSITGKMLDLRWLAFAGLYIMVAGMFGIVAFSMLRQTRRRKSVLVDTAGLEPVLPSNTTNKLELPVGHNDYISSVVEGTTDLLEAPVNDSRKSSLL